jgi:hypothetical protein
MVRQSCRFSSAIQTFQSRVFPNALGAFPLSMNLDFNWMQPVLVYETHHQLVVTLALILTFSPATVLIGKLKFLIFKQVIHEDDEFAHAGREGDEWFFTCGPEVLIEGFEDAIMPHRT